jgi:hypothetical protein
LPIKSAHLRFDNKLNSIATVSERRFPKR